MRNLDHLEAQRIQNPEMQALMDDDFIGAYLLRLGTSHLDFLALVSIHDRKWEHVSISTECRCPRWDEMQHAKELQMAEKVLKQQKEDIQAAITAEMDILGMDEMLVDIFTVRYKEIVSQKFDSAAFKATHKDLYEQYCKTSINRRFTIT